WHPRFVWSIVPESEDGGHTSRRYAQPWKARSPCFGQIGHMAFTDKREKVVFAKGVKFDVFHDHHILGVRFENGVVEYTLQALIVTTIEKPKSRRRALGCIDEPFSGHVFSE